MEEKIKNLMRAVAGVYCHNIRLIGEIGQVRNYYVYGRPRPKDCALLSQLLRCEGNGAHERLENVFAALKLFKYGEFPPRVIEYWLAKSSVRLLNNLRDLDELLPTGLETAADELRHALRMAWDQEDAITNFLLGKSGADRTISSERMSVRLDKFLRDLKRCFNRIAAAMDDVEVGIERQGRKKDGARQRRRREEEMSAGDYLARDRKAILTEVRRRIAAKAARGIALEKKKALEMLYRDEAWSRRCRQWRLDTLYTYLCREMGLGVSF